MVLAKYSLFADVDPLGSQANTTLKEGSSTTCWEYSHPGVDRM